jgi:hypothetical protein
MAESQAGRDGFRPGAPLVREVPKAILELSGSTAGFGWVGGKNSQMGGLHIPLVARFCAPRKERSSWRNPPSSSRSASAISICATGS